MYNKIKTVRMGSLVGGSRRMRKVYSMIRKGAAVDMPVLIIGETGSGKGLVAQELHNRSERKEGPFVAFNTGAVSSELVASELFGHRKGSFTGAVEDKNGRLREASGGTLFLDEIGTMDERMQVSLLRALEDKKIRPIGAKRDVRVNFRLVAATNEDLEQAVRDGHFRDDLLYRLRVLCINLPPLRRRPDDVPMLCKEFIREINSEYDFDIQGITLEAMTVLQEYEWPGNLRELKNVLAQATVTATSGKIQIGHLPGHITGRPSSDADLEPEADLDPFPSTATVDSSVTPPAPEPVQSPPAAPVAAVSEATPDPAGRAGEDGLFIPVGATLEDVQRAYTLKTLESCNNNKTQAAKLLNVSRKALYDKLIRWGEDKNLVQ